MTDARTFRPCNRPAHEAHLDYHGARAVALFIWLLNRFGGGRAEGRTAATARTQPPPARQTPTAPAAIATR